MGRGRDGISIIRAEGDLVDNHKDISPNTYPH